MADAAQQNFRREYDSTPCPRCGRYVRVKRDGTLAKHVALTGKEPCESSNPTAAAAWVVVRYNDYPESGDITVYGPFSSQADAEAHAGKVRSAVVEPLVAVASAPSQPPSTA